MVQNTIFTRDFPECRRRLPSSGVPLGTVPLWYHFGTIRRSKRSKWSKTSFESVKHSVGALTVPISGRSKAVKMLSFRPPQATFGTVANRLRSASTPFLVSRRQNVPGARTPTAFPEPKQKRGDPSRVVALMDRLDVIPYRLQSPKSPPASFCVEGRICR